MVSLKDFWLPAPELESVGLDSSSSATCFSSEASCVESAPAVSSSALAWASLEVTCDSGDAAFAVSEVEEALGVALADALSWEIVVVCVASSQAARLSVTARLKDKTAMDFFTNFPFSDTLCVHTCTA